MKSRKKIILRNVNNDYLSEKIKIAKVDIDHCVEQCIFGLHSILNGCLYKFIEINLYY